MISDARAIVARYMAGEDVRGEFEALLPRLTRSLESVCKPPMPAIERKHGEVEPLCYEDNRADSLEQWRHDNDNPNRMDR